MWSLLFCFINYANGLDAGVKSQTFPLFEYFFYNTFAYIAIEDIKKKLYTKSYYIKILRFIKHISYIYFYEI